MNPVYKVVELCGGRYAVCKDPNPERAENDLEEVCVYRDSVYPNAKELAQAKCDRLNAKYRKEQK